MAFPFEALMSRLFRLKRVVPLRQGTFFFVERSRRRERWFKLSIVATTLVVVAALIAAAPRGRYLVVSLADRSRQLAWQAVGVPPDRSEIDAEWARYRQRGIVDKLREFQNVYAGIDPPLRRLMKYAGNDPETGILRWGNYSRTLLLPSTVFVPDDTGRSYRLRPSTRSVWLRNLTIQRIPLTFFLVPDGPDLGEAMRGTTAVRVEGSVQTTNSWGLRGPEPDTDATLRGIILGDSYMQGLFVGDDQTPSECLKRHLSRSLKTRVEILNTGHLGYSPEQEYYTLREYADRFRPRFVVLSLFANDFGDLFEVLEGKGDWEEGKYWLGQITQFCRTRGLICLTVPAPWVNQLEGQRKAGFYPGMVSNILESTGQSYLDPFEDFATELLRLSTERQREGRPTSPNPLFNGSLGDGHFSPLGCDLWARAVAKRLGLLLGDERIEKEISH
ncbi:MAG: SGNH/GDSL hydrolase family protein [Planctomycetaceae bacterium]|nr:SGNH/GDSL hydrolase family protein [Planctomycetaceae bacterium]